MYKVNFAKLLGYSVPWCAWNTAEW